MNIENLTILAEKLERLPTMHFSMRDWDCGTAACIGGWTNRWFPDAESAYEALGLENGDNWEGTGRQLFYPGPGNCPELRVDPDDRGRGNDLYDRIWAECGHPDLPPADAAKVVRNLIATGKVDWSVLNG